MKYYGLNELRQLYLEFFEGKAHLRKDSYSLVPYNDNSLLLINSGMAPLKSYFTGEETPPSKRMTTCQKCIRTGDIENVGKTSRHGTFFEMLGNFSFGDYFKKEAIAWAWEFFTVILEIPKENLHVSVYKEDLEAEKIWHEQEKVSMDHIVRLGKADNFWEHGAGPCGPCSEIYLDRGVKYGCESEACGVGCDCDRYVEIWNLVFTQFEATAEGEYLELANPNIDTGMGLERLAVMMQDVASIFDVDTIKSVRDHVCTLAGVTYQKEVKTDISIRIITDHIRSVTFMTSDGVLPSNEGRGYVLRRLLRRAARHGKLLGIKDAFLEELVRIVIETSKEAYPELEEKAAYIHKVIGMEEERFAETIDYGLTILNDYIEEMNKTNKKELEGEKAFILYDTYGFPLDLTLEILEEKGLTVDKKAFEMAMTQQRKRAREARNTSNYMGADATIYHQLEGELKTEFLGYDTLEMRSTVKALTTAEAVVKKINQGEQAMIFVEATPFYATSGGQKADRGQIESENGVMKVVDVQKVVGGKWAHIGEVIRGYISLEDVVSLKVDVENRREIMRNHSATHLLQQALKDVLGDHIEQAGSSVDAKKLRFDFTHFSSMSQAEVTQVETLVNEKIQAELGIHTETMPINQAKEKGAMALFGEKYGDTVRVVRMGDYSIELCGGTHLKNTSKINLFKIISEGGVAAGIRRIEALTGRAAINYYKEKELLVDKIGLKIKADSANLLGKIESLLEEHQSLKREMEKLKAQIAGATADQLFNQVKEIEGVVFLSAKVEGMAAEDLRKMGDKFIGQRDPSVVVLATFKEDKVALIVMASKRAVTLGIHAGKIIQEAAKVVGGGGGGRPNVAQAGGRDTSKIAEALETAERIVKEQIGSKF